ncbi:UDP-N-acetylmuramate dehydrogenase [Candidatus Peregrinibacteria bacterium]|jgi:UDP-N-acetylmuramate dehydrogenase|nr:UDP-N-acetylmuramate dehydrogenase [Candidatus Peregrinibacteria bacterium]
MEILENHSLGQYGTFQIGGPADYFLEAKSVEELKDGLKWAEEKNLPYFVFGMGSNLLFDDEGFRGLVIRVKTAEIEVKGEEIHADAGVLAAVLVMEAAKAELTGLEEWNGLPGTVGGAVFGNAGCFGVETKDVLKSAEIFVPGEGASDVPVEFFEFGYRESKLKREPAVVLRAVFELKKGETGEILAKMDKIMRDRAGKQPAGLTTGSFFKNPSPEKPAGMLIDQAGLKGHVHGAMQISDQHANFFFNRGGATAADVRGICEFVQGKVEEKFGIKLEPELIFVPVQ